MVAQKVKRLDRCRQLLKRFTKKSRRKVVFSDEKIFRVEEKMNEQNDCVYGVAFEDIPENLRTVQCFQSKS